MRLAEAEYIDESEMLRSSQIQEAQLFRSQPRVGGEGSRATQLPDADHRASTRLHDLIAPIGTR
jgi:hypothetical protein